MKVDGLFVKISFVIAVMALSRLPVQADVCASHDVSRMTRLVQFESTRKFSIELVRDLQSHDAAFAARAALALGRTKDARAFEALAKMFVLAHDSGVRAMSIYGMGLLAERVTTPPRTLMRGMVDRDSIVRAAAIDAAQRTIAARRESLGGLDAALVTRMQSDPDPIVRGRAAVALASFAAMPQAAHAGSEVIEAFVREKNATVRWHEAWALGRAFPSAVSRERIEAGLADRDDLVRMAFLIVAGRSSDVTLAHVIEPLVHDPSWRVAEQATESLKRLEGGERTEHLVAVPEGVVTPGPVPEGTTSPLPRPSGLGAVRKPQIADLCTSVPFHLTSAAASLDEPLPGLHPRVRIGTTKGSIVVRLYPEWAPLTVASFLNLVDRGFYDGLRWFRIVPNFVVQTGNQKNDGSGTSPFTIVAEENPLEQRPGIIAMGLDYEKNEAVRDSAGTEFYITMSPQMHLNRAFSVFGEVEGGFDVLGRLIESDTMTRVEELPPD